MKWQRIKAIIKKEILRITKDPATLFMVIIFPLFLTIAFGFSFGAIGGNSETTYEIAVINSDSASENLEWAVNFIDKLSENEIFSINLDLNETDAQNELVEGKISAIIVIPQYFGDSIDSLLNSPNSEDWTYTTIALQLDQGSMMISSLLPPVIEQILFDVIFETGGPIEIPISIGTPQMVEVDEKTQFDYFAPGLFTLAAIFLIMTIAQGITNEKEKGLMKRMYLTPLVPSDVMAGQTISNLITAIAQTFVIFIAASIMGYNPGVSVGALLIALLTISLFSLTCIGFGLITGIVSKNEGMATGMSFVFIAPMMFLGTFMTFGEPSLINRLMPSYYVTETLTNLFLRQTPIFSSVIWTNILIIGLISAVVYCVGIISFKKFIKN